jgi:AraC-like DNA-binding protein
MNRLLFILILVLLSFQTVAYPSLQEKRDLVDQLSDGSYREFKEIDKLYQKCHSSSDALQLMKDLDKLIRGHSGKSLNHIAAASRISALGDHSLALQQLRTLSSKLHSQSTYIRGEYHVTVGEITYRSENPKGAIQHIEKGITLLKKSGENGALQAAYVSLGLAHGALDQHEQALVYYDEAEKIFQHPPKKVQLYIQLNRALSFTYLQKHDLSKIAFQEALSIIKETEDYFAEVRTYGNLADIYLMEDSLKQAEYYLLKGRKLATKQGFKLDLVRFDLTLSELYKRLGKFETAFFYLKSHDSIRNSIHIEKAAENVVQLEKINQQAIDKLKQDSLKNTIQLKKQKNWILWGGIILLSLFSSFLLRQFLIIRTKNKVLLKKNLPEGKKELHARQANQNSVLNDDDLTLINAFEKLMMSNKTFCTADLTQDKVAKKLGTNRTYLSKAINDHYNMSYSRWLNEVRISESKKMLVDEKYDHYSIEGIATSVGFSSLSTFNSNFKSITGLTPSYFRKNYSKY